MAIPPSLLSSRGVQAPWRSRLSYTVIARSGSDEAISAESGKVRDCLAEFILSIGRFFAPLRMTKSEGLAMTAKR